MTTGLRRWSTAALLAAGGMLVSTAAMAQKEVVVGLMCDRTGPTSTVGTVLCPGMNDYVALVNSRGGIEGFQIRALEIDNEYKVPPAVESYERFKKEGAISVAIYGTPMVQALTARHRLVVTTHFSGEEPDMRLEIKEGLYRIAMEAIQNVIKHAEARHIDLTLSTMDDHVALEIRDDGKGFDKNKPSSRNGLRNMTSRAAEVGGTFEIKSELGKGSQIRLSVPMLQKKLIGI